LITPCISNKNNGKHKNNCRCRASEERNFSILKELSERYHLYYSINKEALTNIHESLMAQKSWYEKMDCALSASWEADIIILVSLC
jgi:hypothetical protein